jgi:predicted RNase H-like HicB family nuclease
MLTEFIEKKLKEAKYKLLKDGTYFGEIVGITGVWASAKNLEDCRQELKEVLEDWLLLKLKFGEIIPGMRIKIDKRQLVGSHA